MEPIKTIGLDIAKSVFQPKFNISQLERHQWAAVGELTIDEIKTGSAA